MLSPIAIRNAAECCSSSTRETKRTQLSDGRGVTHRLAVPMGPLLEDVQVRSMLRQAGSDAEINDFIEDCRKDLA